MGISIRTLAMYHHFPDLKIWIRCCPAASPARNAIAYNHFYILFTYYVKLWKIKSNNSKWHSNSESELAAYR